MASESASKKSAGILTLYNECYNFGGLLQAYALPTILKKNFGVSAEQINYSFKAKNDNRVKEKLTIGNIIYKLGIAFFRKLKKNNLNKRKKTFEQFMEEIPHSDRIYNSDNIDESLKEYDIFICGGDQIWNDYNTEHSNRNIKVYTLQFVPSEFKKIAYAPSMAVLEASPKFKKIMSDGLNLLEAISVREKRSLSLLQPLTDNNIKVVVDPVLLMTENEWAQEAIEQEKKDKYILCYLLGDSIEQRKAAAKSAKKFNCKIVTFPHILENVVRKCDLFFGDIHDYTSGPHEFISLIKNAEFLITDSFHACVFSMIFKTPFAVFERGGTGENGTMNSRIYDFLEEYHLKSQLVSEQELTEMKKIPKIDFTYAHNHWEKRREESLEYLKNALKND